MRRPVQLKRLLLVALVVLLGALPRTALAGEKDADGLVAVAGALSAFVDGQNDEALGQLYGALKTCAGAACDPNTRAQLYVAMGIVQGAGKKDLAKAREAFDAALKEDPKVVPDRQFMTKDLQKLFNDAKAEVKKPAGPVGPTLRPGPTRQQFEQIQLAAQQLAQNDWSTCMGTAIASLAEREFAAGKLQVAICEDRGGLMLEAGVDARSAVKYAEEEGNAEVGRRATALVAKLETDTPAIVVLIPKAVDKPELFIDGVGIPKEKTDKPIPHNPGKATIELKGRKGQFPFAFKSTESFDRGEKVTVNVEQEAGKGNSAVTQCILAARTAADVNLCIETGGKGRGLTLRGGVELATYNDSFNVDVFSPTAFFSAENPTSGWRVGASYTVDVVSNASPDIVATASRRFDEVRNAGTLSGEYKVGVTRLGIDAGFSIEPDYTGRSFGGSISADLAEKMVTPTLAYHVGLDTLALAHTSWDVFSRQLTTHSLDASLSLIASVSTLVVLGGTGEIDLGDSSKPYRHIPMFSAATVAAGVPRAATPDLVNAVRLAPEPLEQLPDARRRVAAFLRVAHRWESTTLRADERLYLDSWGLKATTTDARMFFDVRKDLRLGPHVRFHAQGPVDFWQRAYTATPTATGWQLPQYRTGDRELGPLVGLTFGASARYALTDILALSFQAEGVYTQYLDHLFIADRLGLLTATTLEIGVE